MKLKKLLSIFLCFVICSLFAYQASAAATSPKISISNKTALPGKEVTLDISITNNPGIMAMTFSVAYDNNQFEFVSYSKGYISEPRAFMDHSDKGYVAFSIVESKDKTNTGNMLSLTFKIKDKAAAGTYPIRLANHYYETSGYSLNNCFANSKQEFVIPTVTAGSITVEETCENSGHKYGGWKIISEANCTETGKKEHTCNRCGVTETAIIPITHSFEAEWTVDKAATPTQDGIMSRHCTKCDEVTDKITFSYKEIADENENTSSGESPSYNPSSEQSSTDNSSTDSSFVENSSIENSTSENQVQNSDFASNTVSKKPVINNTAGSKVPLSEVEKLEDYKQNIEPNKENQESSETEIIEEYTSGQSISGNNQNKGNADKASTGYNTSNIILLVICALLSAGIIALGIVLIIKKRKTE